LVFLLYFVKKEINLFTLFDFFLLRMGMGMGIRKYPLPGGDGDGSKVVYPLGLGMGMGMNFYYGDGDGIMIPVPAPPRCHPYTLSTMPNSTLQDIPEQCTHIATTHGHNS